jgi:hypothetical protein
VAQLNPWSGKVVDRVEVGSSPEAVTDAYGAIWTRTASTRAPSFGSAKLETTRIETEAPALFVVASAGQLWVATGPRDCVPRGAILRIDPASLSVTGWLPAACPTWAHRD